MLISRLLSFIFISLIFCSGEITISRTYAVNTDISKSISNDNSKISIEGGISFQACDSSACIPVYQELSHTINKDNKIFISENLSPIENDNPFVPDWGSLEVSGFGEIDDNKINYAVKFNIKPGYHIFTTDTLLSPLGTGNTDFFWEDNDFLVAELAYQEPTPYVKYNKVFGQNIGYHDGNIHDQIDYSNQSESKEGSSTLLSFFIGAFIAGLAAIFTPCVFPMIPLTVSFFH